MSRMPKCVVCGVAFFGRPTGKYCSPAHRREAEARIYRENNPAPTVSSGTRGAISELLVCADLLSKGYEVFRSVSQSCSCDLAVMKDDQLKRVEVRTGYRTRNGKLMYPKKPGDAGRYDVYAVVVGGEIHYIPELP